MASTAHGRTVLIANPSADLYGSDRMMLEGVRGLVELGWHVVVTSSDDGPLIPLLRAAGADVVFLDAPVIRKSALRPGGLVRLIREIATQTPRMRRLVAELEADVVMVNTVTIPFWLRAARRAGAASVVHVHEAESTLSAPARALLTRPLRWASGVVFNSQTSRRVSGSAWLERRDRARVVLNGIAGPDRPSPARIHLDGPLRVVYVGRLSPRKGVDLAIDAIDRLRSAGIDAELDIVGDVFRGYEWYERQLREQISRLALEDRVRIVGFQRMVWDIVSAADVAVVPSRGDESFGNVLIEALMCARPVVAADHSGLREASGGLEAAVLVPTDSADGLARGLTGVRDDWAAMRDRAWRDAETVRRRHSPDAYHRALSDALAERIGDLGARAPGRTAASTMMSESEPLVLEGRGR